MKLFSMLFLVALFYNLGVHGSPELKVLGVVALIIVCAVGHAIAQGQAGSKGAPDKPN